MSDPMVDVVVLVDDDHLRSMATVAERLRAAGMRIDSQDELGTLTGAVEPTRLGRLQQVDGVERVEAARGFRLQPPDAEIQ
jgi:hypothetical protein